MEHLSAAHLALQILFDVFTRSISADEARSRVDELRGVAIIDKIMLKEAVRFYEGKPPLGATAFAERRA